MRNGRFVVHNMILMGRRARAGMRGRVDRRVQLQIGVVLENVELRLYGKTNSRRGKFRAFGRS